MSQANKILKHAGSLSVSTADGVKINQIIVPQTCIVPFHFDENHVDATIFISGGPWEIISVKEAHTVAGSDLGAVTGMVTKCTGTQAPDAGANILQSAFNLKSTANTVVTGTLVTTSDIQLVSGDRICLNFTGTLTALKGGAITIEMKRI